MKSTDCPCCTQPLSLVGQGKYTEFLCSECDHTYFKSESGISAEDYENSDKYADYYTGAPPFLWYHKQALKAAQTLPRGSRVLDFGCYDGFFVKRMLDNDVDAYGCDWNLKALEAGGRKFDIGNRLSSDGEGLYDAVIALEVIEHFEDPNVFMEVASKLLKSGGSLFLSCPNKNAVYRPSTDQPPHHFSRFSANSLETIVSRYGFDVTRQEIEYSFPQMTRNFIGDRMRSRSTNVDESPKPGKVDDSGLYVTLRKTANKIVPIAEAVSTPLSAVMKAINKPYIAQFLEAKKK
ncbi:class I SAM-dependent methyltransferase [Octadecabacter ascidiaceicola]|uniref:Ubiquinone biosynthesis O-methyltransferase n=1 Tax=Octadecabacter ascidiaceicola TaxID=1655543 RepID=A0A238KT62_9RHOB|nr:class I SAM-dependent methyltransferase [Octadecabacter ascidiaceicola]SMX45312.1 Ubiquinone biosynthesis O-methyltransferase [Octadecabacter ascidiaceicola]